jgi:hypothetical protein
LVRIRSRVLRQRALDSGSKHVVSVLVAAIVFVCTFGGSLLGMAVRAMLPKSHLSPESKEVIGVATGLLAALAALVMGLLVASAKAEFDAQEIGFQQLSANIVLLDRMLAHYGPETSDARAALRGTVIVMIDQLWPGEGGEGAGLDSAQITSAGDKLYDAIRDLAPTTDAQRAVQAQALQTSADLARTRWLLSGQHDSASLGPFLVVLLFWLLAIFVSFGLFAPPNGAVVTALLVSALATAGAIFLIVDLDQPSAGLIQVSSAPLRYAVSQLGK